MTSINVLTCADKPFFHKVINKYLMGRCKRAIEMWISVDFNRDNVPDRRSRGQHCELKAYGHPIAVAARSAL